MTMLRCHPPIALRVPAGFRQQGAALVFSLLILLVLTILGVSAMRTSSLEQIMAGNTQEGTRALQAADSGTARALNKMVTEKIQPSAFPPPPPYSFVDASASVTVPTFRQNARTPVRSEDPSGEPTCFWYYNHAVTGIARLNATVAVNQGLRTLAAPPDGTTEVSCK